MMKKETPMSNVPISGGIAILGSTGSIGQQALEVLEEQDEISKLQLITAASNIKMLLEQCKRYQPKMVYLANSEQRPLLKQQLLGSRIELLETEEEVYQQFFSSDISIVLLAIVGFAGFKPALKALEAGKRLAIANKESLVVGGQLIMDLVHHKQLEMIPVDSEHSAIYQCLLGEKQGSIEKVILTASGGPFFNLPKEEWPHISLAEALQHPTWEMGQKITIDSASMMNKGLEVIEARWLFDLQAEQIDVVVHPQSYIHSMVQFKDGSVKAQLSPPNMKGPIQYALYAPQRPFAGLTRFNFSEAFDLSFKPIDMEKFRNLALAFEALKKGGNMPAILNAANEAAVDAVLCDQLPFYKIPQVIESIMGQMNWIAQPGFQDLEDTHYTSIIKTKELIRRIR
jgi:1-deoxy-D-xylulose-5-phosphate reductoisomerase